MAEQEIEKPIENFEQALNALPEAYHEAAMTVMNTSLPGHQRTLAMGQLSSQYETPAGRFILAHLTGDPANENVRALAESILSSPSS